MIDNLISIITPMYNSEKFIKETIESVIRQTYTNWEMIIVDDFSSDKCSEIVKSFTEKDKRIKYIRNEFNKGIAESRNIAISNSSGRFIAFLDSDDIWNKDKLEIQINTMIEKNLAMSFTAYELIDGDSKEINKVIYNKKSIISYNHQLKGNCIGCLTVMLDRSKINFDISFKNVKHEDYVLWLDILKNGYVAYYIDMNLAKYRKLNKSASSNKLKSALWTWNIYRKIEKLSIYESIFYFIHYSYKSIKKAI